MSIQTVRETNEYSYDKDTLYGTGWFVRKSDDMVSLMDTGTDRDVLILTLENKGICNDTAFNAIAKSRTYNNRFEEDS